MFTKLEMLFIISILFFTIAFAMGAYAVYNNTLTLNFLSVILAVWIFGKILFFGALTTHFQLRGRRIIAKDY